MDKVFALNMQYTCNIIILKMLIHLKLNILTNARPVDARPAPCRREGCGRLHKNNKVAQDLPCDSMHFFLTDLRLKTRYHYRIWRVGAALTHWEAWMPAGFHG
jgi:hypothetical protein